MFIFFSILVCTKPSTSAGEILGFDLSFKREINVRSVFGTTTFSKEKEKKKVDCMLP